MAVGSRDSIRHTGSTRAEADWMRPSAGEAPAWSATIAKRMNTVTDSELVARAAGGNAECMGELFDRHAGRM